MGMELLGGLLGAMILLGGTRIHEVQALDAPRPVTCRAAPAADTPGNAPHLAGICAALNARPELLALDPGLQVTLVTEAMTDSHVTAYLEWQGTTGPERGPSVDIGVLDAPLGPAQYAFFARSLTEATNLP